MFCILFAVESGADVPLDKNKKQRGAGRSKRTVLVFKKA
jgi:hypothetical protein